MDLFNPPRKQIAFLDGLRAISIFWVIFFHLYFFAGLFLNKQDFLDLFNNVFAYLAISGSYGVDLFFVLSGFLISRILYREYDKTNTICLKSFYLRRSLRLLPAYYFVLFLNYIFQNTQYPCKNIWSNIIYINNYLSVNDTCMPWSWSLAIEEQFYILFPLFLLFSFTNLKRPLTALLFILGVSFAINLIFHSMNMHLYPLTSHPTFSKEAFQLSFDTFYSKTHLRFGNLLWGVLAAYLIHYYPKKVKSLFNTHFSHYFGLFIIVGICLSLFTTQKGPFPDLIFILFDSLKRYLFGLSLFLLFILLEFPKGPTTYIRSFLSLKIWYPFAQLSYSSYLVHPIVITLYFAINESNLLANLYFHFVISLFLSFFVSYLLYTTIERPFMNLRKKLS